MAAGRDYRSRCDRVVEEFSLYFHVPFCTRKCDYCHFYVIPNEPRFHALYMEALQQEWELRAPLIPSQGLASIYFGGGTPSLLGSERIAEILSWINPSPEVEVTLEANPEPLFPFPGVNRLSLGVQSFDNPLLTTLTRSHTASQAEKTVYALADAGIENISIDLMYDLHGQTLASWEKTLSIATSLPITHLSLYNLTIEPHTVFYKKRKQLHLPPDSLSLEMLEMAVEKLEQAGLVRYEISAFAKPGFASRHNTGYWTGRPFLGFGPSACSYWDGARFRNIPHLNRYAKKLKNKFTPEDFYEKLTPFESLKEKLAIRLRLLEGLNGWPIELRNLYTILSTEGFLDPYLLRLTNKGILFHDSVAEIIINQ